MTQPVSVGPYTCPISITSNGESGTFTVSVTVVSEVLDQQQTQYTNSLPVYGCAWRGQSFTPTVTSITRVELYMKKIGNPTTDVVFWIRSSLPGSNDLVSVSKPASQISTTNSWVEFDFTDLPVTLGTTYYMGLRTSGGSSTNCYSWGYGSSTSYTSGTYWSSTNCGNSWTPNSGYDFCFKTYGFV